jgi:phosphatidylinositol 3-kinase
MDYPMIDAVELYWKKYRKVFGGGPEGHEPSASAYEYLMELLSRPLTWHWTPEHHALLWKYRYWLKSQEHALPKFILIIDWDDREEVEMVTDILLTWTPPSLWTCWELMAVDGPYLPEDIDLIWAAAFSRSLYDIDYEMLTLFLSCILQYFERIAKIQEFYPIDESGRDSNGVQKKKSAVSLLADLLMDKAVEWPAFAQNLFWSLKLKSKEISTERDTPIAKDNVYARLLGMLLHRLQKEDTDDLDGETPSAVQTLFRQEQVFLKFCTLFKDPRLARISRPQRIELLREITGDPANGVLSFVTLPLPYDASIHVTGTLPDKLTVFKSTAMPVRISFVTTSISEHGIIFKAGEDLRQDIFVLGVLRLFDTIWRGDGLDLRLTPYRCMALSLSDGILEFVPSEPLSNIIAVYGGAGSILSYLNAANLDPSMTSLASTFDLVEKSSSSTTVSVTAILEKVPTSVLETYVRSCAGYCVFTYVLGVGDRHLDNLLLTRDGRFFHVDFAYIFGRDPKPFPPPMKLCKEMVEAMGGPTGALFRRFKSLCFASFCLLRRHARLIVAYLDVCKGDRVATRYVQERLMLDMEELDALLALERLIDDSMTALFPKMFETLHKWAQYWRQ